MRAKSSHGREIRAAFFQLPKKVSGYSIRDYSLCGQQQSSDNQVSRFRPICRSRYRSKPVLVLLYEYPCQIHFSSSLSPYNRVTLLIFPLNANLFVTSCARVPCFIPSDLHKKFIGRLLEVLTLAFPSLCFINCGDCIFPWPNISGFPSFPNNSFHSSYPLCPITDTLPEITYSTQ